MPNTQLDSTIYMIWILINIFLSKKTIQTKKEKQNPKRKENSNFPKKLKTHINSTAYINDLFYPKSITGSSSSSRSLFQKSIMCPNWTLWHKVTPFRTYIMLPQLCCHLFYIIMQKIIGLTIMMQISLYKIEYLIQLYINWTNKSS